MIRTLISHKLRISFPVKIEKVKQEDGQDRFVASEFRPNDLGALGQSGVGDTIEEAVDALRESLESR